MRIADRVAGVLRRPTSIAAETDYPAFCRRAARDSEVFETFKRAEVYRAILEHVTPEDGRRYLDRALDLRPDFAGRLDAFRENDTVGQPLVHDYGDHGAFSPTTLRYAKVLADLTTMFGDLDGLRIAEIGGGYGGQCFMLSTVASPASYTLIDLDEALELQGAYLDRLGVRGVELVRPAELSAGPEFDLVISNYAFSELVRSVQRRYLRRVLQRSARGYVTYNWMAPKRFRGSHTRGELLNALPGSRFEVPVPQLADIEELWVWGVGR